MTNLIRLSLIFSVPLAVYTQNWIVLFAGIVTFFLTFLPQMVANQINVRLPLQFEFAIVAFLYASLFLGEALNYYGKFFWWDTALHGLSAFAFGFIGFLILFVLYASGRLKASPALISLFSFSFAMALGAVWEIFEFLMDLFFGLDMQKSGLRDTMGDLIIDAVGAGVASVTGYIFLKYKVWDPFDHLIHWFLKSNPRIKRKTHKKHLV